MLEGFRRRLPRSSIAWFAAAALAAIGAWAASRAHIASVEATRPDVGTPTPIVVAASDLDRGATLAEGMLEVTQVPATLVPPGAFTDPAAATGRVLVADLVDGEALTRTRVASPGTGPVAAVVPSGFRAFVLPAGPPAGTVTPGDEVDVLATYGANAGRPYTETVATSLEVVDVVASSHPATSAPGGAPQGPPLVVLADPATVERLARAAGLAILSVAVVSGDEPPAWASPSPSPSSSPSAAAPVSAVTPAPSDGP